MKYRTSGRFSKPISEIGFGAWQLGNTREFDPMNERDARNLVQEALQAGITFFDTAPNYGQGKSEEILGEVLQGTEDRVFINTKAGHNSEGQIDFSLDAIRRSIDQSLKRLRRDTLDSVILHNPEPKILRGETKHYELLKELKDQGLIHGFGVSIDSPEELEAALAQDEMDVIELLFHIHHQSPKIYFDQVKERELLLIAKVPLDSGWLTGKYDADHSFGGIRSRWSRKDIQLRAELIRELKSIVQQDDLVPIALSFILSFEAFTTVIPGIRTHMQLRSNIEAAQYELDDEMKDSIEAWYASKVAPLQLPW